MDCDWAYGRERKRYEMELIKENALIPLRMKLLHFRWKIISYLCCQERWSWTRTDILLNNEVSKIFSWLNKFRNKQKVSQPFYMSHTVRLGTEQVRGMLDHWIIHWGEMKCNSKLSGSVALTSINSNLKDWAWFVFLQIRWKNYHQMRIPSHRYLLCWINLINLNSNACFN